MKAKELFNPPISPAKARPHSKSKTRLAGLVLSGLAVIASALAPATIEAQTNLTIKPFQIRFEVPPGLVTNVYLTNCNLRIPTNGASGVDGTGTNWIIPDVTVSISGAPAGCTASLLASDLTTPVSDIPVALNTGNTAKNTNLVVGLSFNGSQTGGTTTLSINASGAGLDNDVVYITSEVAKLWNGNATTGPGNNWSDPSQWLTTGVPQAGDNVVFRDVGAQSAILSGGNVLTNSVVDTTTTISSLRFAQTSGTTNSHNLYINPGVTLALKGDDGFKMLRDNTYVNQKMFVSISGTNGAFVQTNENSDFSIIIDGASGSAAYGTLDMSRLGNLNLDVNQVNIGDAYVYPNYWNLATNGYTSGSTLGSSLPNKMNDTWLMAQTNFVKAVYVDPDNYTNANDRNYSVMLGRNNISGGSSGNDDVISLGASNVFYIDSMCVAGYACLGGVVNFQNNNSYALFRNVDGVSRMTTFTTADAAGVTYGSTSGAATKAGPIDFSKGYVDMLVDKFYLSRDRGVRIDSGGQSQTAFDMGQGIIDANTAILGFQNEGTQSNISYCYATMVVSNTAVFKVNDELALGYTTAAEGAANQAYNGYGRLNIGPGGTVYANKITVGGVTKQSAGNNITIVGGGSLVVSNTIGDATPGGALGTLTMNGDASLTLFINGTNASGARVYLTNLTATGTGNKLIIGGVTNVTFPVDIALIAGVGSGISISPSAFDGGVETQPGITGILSLSSSNTINIHLINRTPHHLVWRASGNTATWDYSSLNWLDTDTGLTTNYNNPDFVTFDDTPGHATNVVLGGGSDPLTPLDVTMTNNTVYYTFQDGGNSILGGPSLNKYGTGTVEVDGNTTLAAQLNQGSLVGSGSIGSATIAAGTTMNFTGNIGGSVIDSGIATLGGTVAGTLTVQSGGVVTNSGTVSNPFSVETGGILYNNASGSLHNIGAASSGSAQVAAGGILINAGTIGEVGNGDILFVNGTFEDLGSTSLTLSSLTVGSGGTFIPGGDGVGNTTINNDGNPSGFPGALLLQLGSTTVFKVDPSVPANTTVTSAHLSFGGSSSAQTQNGGTLIITNVNGAPFTAGQSFKLFVNVFGAPLFSGNTGASTNTYPTIVPASPGPGLAWDLRHLWLPDAQGHDGVVSVVNANAGPTFTSTYSLTSTNIALQFSWDPSNLGMRLESLTVPRGQGINATNPWTGIAGSWTNTTVNITNNLSTNNVFYRLVFP